MIKQILSEEFRRMQKLAGIITENEEANDEQKLKDILKADYATFVTKLGANINDPKFIETIKSIADKSPIKTSDITAKVKELKPTQNEIDVDGSLKYPLTDVPSATAYLKGGAVSPAGKNIVTGGGGKFIIDGHHRWSQVYCLNPEASITAMDISNITNPVDGLKSAQLGIVGDTGKIKIATVTGDNLLKIGEDALIAYVKKTITPEVVDEFKKYNKGDNAEAIAAYIWKNVQQMQQNNQPVAPKAPRGIMPQTDDAPNWVSDAPVPLTIK